MDTYMEVKYPWLIEEKKKIKEFVVNLKKPYLGFCLGCQLLGEVVGGKVTKSKPPEIGIMDINFSKNKNNDILFSNFPDKIKSLQWHSYEVSELENRKDITLLASSPITKYQIFKYQNHAYGIQFHIEIEDPGYLKDLMLEDGVSISTVELDKGEQIPNDLSKFDGMFCMGGSLGFSFVFIIFGAAASFLGQILLQNSQTLRIVAGLIIIIFSLPPIGIINIGFLNLEKKIYTTKNNNVWFSFVVGMAFGFGWTPCIGPILGSIMS